MSLAETANLAVNLNLGGNFQSGLAKAEGQLSHFSGTAGNTHAALSRLGQNLQRVAAIGVGAFAGAIVGAVKLAGDFEAQMNTINTIAFATPEALGKIGDGIRKIARDTGISLTDLTSAYYDLLSAGVKTADAQSLLNNAVTLGVGGLATTTETVNLLTTAYNAYGLTSAQATQATDMFAQAVADGKVKASEIAATFANVASIAKAYGIGIDQIAASYGFLTAQGVPAAEVTTEMNRAIISLIKPSADLEAAQKKLHVVFAEEIRKKGLVPALQELRDYSDKTGTPLISLLGRVEAVKYALQTTGPSEKGFLAELDKIHGSAGEAAKQAAEREKGLNFELARLKALAKDAGITIGSALLPKLTPLVEKLNELISGHQGDIAAFGDSLAKAFTTVGEVVSKIDFGAIGAGLAITGRAAKLIVDAFLSLPPAFQSLAVGAFAVNKVGGGIVTAGIKDIIASVAGRGGGVGGIGAGLLGVQKVFVVNLPPGGMGGGLPGVASAGGLGLVGGLFLGGLLAVTIAGVTANAAEMMGFRQDRKNLIDQNPSLTNAQALALQISQRGGLDSMDVRSRSGALQQFLDANTTYADALAQATTILKKSADTSGAVRAAAQTALANAGVHNLAGTGQTAAIIASLDAHLSKLTAESFTSAMARIRALSIKAFGGTGLGSAAEHGTFDRSMLRLATAVDKSGQTNAQKLTEIRQIQANLLANGDVKVAHKLDALIAKLAPPKPSATPHVGITGSALSGRIDTAIAAALAAPITKSTNNVATVVGHKLDDLRHSDSVSATRTTGAIETMRQRLLASQSAQSGILNRIAAKKTTFNERFVTNVNVSTRVSINDVTRAIEVSRTYYGSANTIGAGK